MSKVKPLSDIVPKITKDIFGKKNMLFGKLLSQWTEIVGKDLAERAVPTDIKYPKKDYKNQATLHLSVRSSHATEISMQKDLIIERLNMFFGYKAVKDIKIIQNSSIMNKQTKSKTAKKALTSKEVEDIDRMVGKIGENDLQIALKNLGKALLSKDKS